MNSTRCCLSNDEDTQLGYHDPSNICRLQCIQLYSALATTVIGSQVIAIGQYEHVPMCIDAGSFLLSTVTHACIRTIINQRASAPAAASGIGFHFAMTSVTLYCYHVDGRADSRVDGMWEGDGGPPANQGGSNRRCDFDRQFKMSPRTTTSVYSNATQSKGKPVWMLGVWAMPYRLTAPARPTCVMWILLYRWSGQLLVEIPTATPTTTTTTAAHPKSKKV
jgi:hypothetical protein